MRMRFSPTFEIFRDESAAGDVLPLRQARLALAVRRFALLLTGMMFIWAVCEVAALCGLMPSAAGLALAGANPFWAGGFFGVTFLYFWSRPTVREFRCMAAGGLALSLVLFLLGRQLAWEAPESKGLNVGLGLAALAAMLTRALRTQGHVRTETLALCLPAFLTMGSTFILAVFFRMSPLRHETLDGVVYAAEQTLGTQPSFWMGRLFEAFAPLAFVSGAVYLNAAVPILCVVALQMRSRRPPAMDAYTIFVVIAVVFSVLCISFPLVGPVFAFGAAFPHQPPPVSEVLHASLAASDVPRNCMPSGHTAWALLVWWQARPFGRAIRALALGNLVFTVLATLGFGLHYLLDLVVAVPAAVAIQALCTPAVNRRERRAAVLCGVGLTALWLVAIFGRQDVLGYSVVLTNLAALGTVIVPLAQERRLYRQLSVAETALPDDDSDAGAEAFLDAGAMDQQPTEPKHWVEA